MAHLPTVCPAGGAGDVPAAVRSNRRRCITRLPRGCNLGMAREAQRTVMKALFDREPTILMALVRQIISLAVAFGLKLTPEQTAALLGLVELVTTLINRAKVTPVGAGP